MEVKVQNEPWCEMCPFVDLIVDKDLSYADNELADMDLYAQCRNLKQCRGAIKRAKALEEQALAKWWEGMGVAPCGQEEQKTMPPMPEEKPIRGKRGLDQIREMSVDEILDLLLGGDSICPPPLRDTGDCRRAISCKACWRQWLKFPSDGDSDA